LTGAEIRERMSGNICRCAVRRAAARVGRLVAIAHEVNMYSSPHSEYAEQTAATTRGLYAAPNRLTRHRLTPLDLPRGEDVRAPGGAPGLLAVESAMHDYGMAAAIRMHFQGPTKARVRIGPDGVAVVQSDMTDIGGGTYTILTQVAAQDLGLPLDRVRVEIGRSDFPVSQGSGGSWGAANSCTALHRACAALREKLLQSACNDARSPLHGRDPRAAEISAGRMTIGSASDALSAIVARNHPEGLIAEGEIAGMETDPNYKAYSLNTYGAHFAEVGVDADTAEIRLRRMLGVFAAGRILNPKTARSQLIGGMTLGVSYALPEEAIVDTRSGAFVNRDLAEYLVPVHADIPEIDAVLLDGFDDKAKVLGAKGIGELGVCGAAAAVTNAVFNVTGIRVREFPITLDKLLPDLPLMEA
jgi:xanthine dehydrogenase YagR molybdenum-binding subunit